MQMLSTYGLSHLVRLVLANRLFVAGGKLPERPMWTYLNSGGDEKENVRPKIVRGQKKTTRLHSLCVALGVFGPTRSSSSIINMLVSTTRNKERKLPPYNR